MVNQCHDMNNTPRSNSHTGQNADPQPMSIHDATSRWSTMQFSLVRPFGSAKLHRHAGALQVTADGQLPHDMTYLSCNGPACHVKYPSLAP